MLVRFVQTLLTISVRRPGAWTARTETLSPAKSRRRWPRGGVMAAVTRGYPPGTRGCMMAPGWSLRWVRRWTASRWQGHVLGRSPSHAGRGRPTSERGTISGLTTLGVWGRGTVTMTGLRLRRSTMAMGTRASPAVVLRARVVFWVAAIASQAFGRPWWFVGWRRGGTGFSYARPAVSAGLWPITYGAPGPGATTYHPLALYQT